VSARKAAEVALRESEEKFRSIVQSSPTAIYLYRLEPDGRLVLTSANPASDRIIGIEHSELIGKTIEEAFPNLADTDIPAMYRSVAAGDLASQSFEIPYQDDRFSGYYQVAVFQTAPNLVAVNFMDISERKRAEEELAARTEDLTRSNADLEKFAYIASHDLQEPLRMVASYTQLLQRRYQGRLDADADEFIGYAVDGATRMQRLINELLVYSRVGSQGSAFVETDLESVLADVLRVLTISIAESGAEVTHDPMPTVVCDPTQIGQVFQNLIVNAIKFRSEDPPRIHVGAESSGDEWVFTVRDNGLGIEPEYFDRIFVIFQRLQSRADYPGTGMGLAICKRIIERHGGRTWVESGEGIGSTFYFTLAAKGKDRHVGNL
jgi:PAS domain S-box-containing protein